MGKLHVKGWGRKTNYLNGKVACQGLGLSKWESCMSRVEGSQKQPAKFKPDKTCKK